MMKLKSNTIYRVLSALCFVIALLFAWGWVHLPGTVGSSLSISRADDQSSSARSVLGDPSIAPQDWNIFLAAGEQPVAEQQTKLGQRYRLAGTFFSFSDNTQTHRIAIIDNLVADRQELLAEQDKLSGFIITSIQRDHVVLEKAGAREVLSLDFAPQPGAGQHRQAASETEPRGGEETMLSENRFGKQISENRWMLKRDALMDYYNELLDDPERIAKIYISLAPDYNEQQKIEGYNLNMVGENDFFEAVGLREGDVIRKVNSMRMVSQARGEYFLKEFVNERLNAVVIDIERDNVPKKMIYLLR
jgi:type II secretion system protein C